MKSLVLVGAGGVIGALVRYLSGEAISSYPLAIFLVNLLGVAIAGYFGFQRISLERRAFWVAGVAGGMTTFSSVALIHAENSGLLAIAYFFGMVAASLAILALIRLKLVR